MPKNMYLNGRNKTQPFAMLTHYMMDSEAFRSLSSGAVLVLLLLIRRYNSLNNGYISLSNREIDELTCMSKSTAGKKLRELELKGFIQTMEKGFFTKRMATTFRLTFHGYTDKKGVKTQATNEWKRYDTHLKQVPNIELKVL